MRVGHAKHGRAARKGQPPGAKERASSARARYPRSGVQTPKKAKTAGGAAVFRRREEWWFGVYAFDSCHSTRTGRRPSVAAPLRAKLSVNLSNPMAAASLSRVPGTRRLAGVLMVRLAPHLCGQTPPGSARSSTRFAETRAGKARPLITW